tara:strand:+ start:46899 stop:47498 length:600 start_codon:yes stop_codon:yes gene_type:complete
MGKEGAGLGEEGMQGVGYGLGAAGGIAKMIIGAGQARRARKAIDAYQRQELHTVTEGLQISSLGADLQREELARGQATSVAALQTGGVRGLVGGIGKLQEQQVAQSRQIGADLDKQKLSIQQAQAQDAARIQQMQETREQQDLAGLGQQLNTGQQNAFGGLGDITQVGLSMGNQGLNPFGGLFGGGGSRSGGKSDQDRS